MLKLVRKGALLSVMMAAICLLAAPVSTAVAQDLVLKGDAKCTTCHDESSDPQLLRIGRTMHGTKADPRTPTCTSCHGESSAHADSKGSKQPKPDVVFGRNGASSASVQNSACQTCHAKDAKRHLWAGSAHESRDVACASCHNVHSGHDKVLDKVAQPEVCYTCHAGQRINANKPWHHPVIEGKMTCSDCHNAHGSAGPALMKRDTVVDTCYACHMEKRGPFVHDHPPVTENCAICHNVHGTTAEKLLKTRQPFLCQTCHTPHNGVAPAVATTAPQSRPGWWTGSTITQGRGCTNCHTQIHGSNNPSLTNPTPQRLFR